jgi:cytochrome c biogenesis protein CcdA
MSEYLQAFVLGNAAILTNVCILPLYPGLIAFLAGNAQNERAQKAAQWMGFLVLLGVLTLMLLVGLALLVLQRSFDALLPILLPVIYGIVIVMGILMLSGRNPFNRLSSSQVPVLRNPFTAAYTLAYCLDQSRCRALARWWSARSCLLPAAPPACWTAFSTSSSLAWDSVGPWYCYRLRHSRCRSALLAG